MKVVVSDTITEEENKDIISLWEPLQFKIDENYEYVPKGILFSIFSNLLYYGIAYPILTVLTKLVYNLKIEGRENIKNLKSGAITVSNHVLVLDCAMVGLACRFKKIYYTTREGSFKIPFVRKLIKLLGAIPIPQNIINKKNFMKQIEELLHNNKIIHLYPEAALWPYCSKIRNFKDGAFHIAVQNDVPIVPMVFKFNEPTGIRKIFKKKKDVTLTILKPIYSENTYIDKKEKVENLKQAIHQAMVSALEGNVVKDE